MTIKVKSIYKGRRAVWLTFKGFRQDNPPWIIEIRKRLIWSNTLPLYTQPLHNPIPVIIPWSSTAAGWKRRIILACSDVAAGSVCQDFLFFPGQWRRRSHYRKNIFFVNINPQKLEFRIPLLDFVQSTSQNFLTGQISVVCVCFIYVLSTYFSVSPDF